MLATALSDEKAHQKCNCCLVYKGGREGGRIWWWRVMRPQRCLQYAMEMVAVCTPSARYGALHQPFALINWQAVIGRPKTAPQCFQPTKAAAVCNYTIRSTLDAPHLHILRTLSHTHYPVTAGLVAFYRPIRLCSR